VERERERAAAKQAGDDAEGMTGIYSLINTENRLRKVNGNAGTGANNDWLIRLFKRIKTTNFNMEIRGGWPQFACCFQTPDPHHTHRIPCFFFAYLVFQTISWIWVGSPNKNFV
jgi:hypothetical protein